MAPSDDDDQRVPDEAGAGAESSELPAAPSRPELGRGDDEAEQRSPGRVVFDVEVDDPSLVMPRPRRRARAKAASEVAEEAEIADGEILDNDNDNDNDSDHDSDHDAPRPLVHGDPLLTGPTPVVRARRPRDRPGDGSGGDESSPSEQRDEATTSAATDDAPAGAASPSSADEAASDDASSASDGPETEVAPGTAEAPDTDDTSPARDVPGPPPSEPAATTTAADDDSARRDEPSGTPSLTPKDLFEPVTGEQPAVPDPPRTDVPPPPPAGGASGDRSADAPPPPPAPALAGTPAPGITRPVPPVTGPTAPTARRAARGAQVTGQTPAVASGDPSGPVPTTRPTAVAPAPRFAGRRPRVRRVTRVVRHVDPWSVFKVAAVFSFVAYGIALVAGVLLWNVAYATGTIDNIERGLESTGWETFELNGGEIFHNAWIGGLFAAVGLTGLAVLVATLFNLITDLVGGVRMTVLEEEVVEKSSSPLRRYAGKTAPDPTPPARPTQPARSSRRR